MVVDPIAVRDPARAEIDHDTVFWLAAVDGQPRVGFEGWGAGRGLLGWLLEFGHPGRSMGAQGGCPSGRPESQSVSIRRCAQQHLLDRARLLRDLLRML